MRRRRIASGALKPSGCRSTEVRPRASARFIVFRVRRTISLAVTTAAVLGCGGSATNPKNDIRRVAVRYIHAAAVGDGKTACSLLSTKGLADGGYSSRAACRRDYSADPLGKTFPVLRITLRDPRTAFVVIGDAAVSDSGNDTIVLRRYGRRWLIDVG